MEIPQWLILIRDWQVVLTPILTALIVILYKPIKVYIIRVYNRFVQQPDTENKTEIGQLRDEINLLRDQITEINNSLEQISEHRKSVQHTHTALLHNALFEKCEKAIRKGDISKDEMKNIDSLYQPYKSIGGNGTAEKLYFDCQKLPLRVKEED